MLFIAYNIRLFALNYTSPLTFSSLNSVWRWECQSGSCQKIRITEDTQDSALSLPACRLLCNKYANLWPKPTGTLSFGNFLVHININSIDVAGPRESRVTDLVRLATNRFLQQIKNLVPRNISPAGGMSLLVNLVVANTSTDHLTWETDESYALVIQETTDGRINATITAENYFGARHGFETLNQLIIFDDLRNEIQIVRDASITDRPVYPHRGILLDTSRNYVTVDVIKKVIEGMAISKLNVLHWHITDTHSFPFVSKSMPYLSRLGAYSPSQVYTPEDIADLVTFAKTRGVNLLPEFDAPAHVGEGWQDTDYVACFNKKPWQDYCVEPPCGQLDPTKEGLYDVLEGILFSIFVPVLKVFDCRHLF